MYFPYNCNALNYKFLQICRKELVIPNFCQFILNIGCKLFFFVWFMYQNFPASNRYVKIFLVFYPCMHRVIKMLPLDHFHLFLGRENFFPAQKNIFLCAMSDFSFWMNLILSPFTCKKNLKVWEAWIVCKIKNPQKGKDPLPRIFCL